MEDSTPYQELYGWMVGWLDGLYRYLTDNYMYYSVSLYHCTTD